MNPIIIGALGLTVVYLGNQDSASVAAFPAEEARASVPAADGGNGVDPRAFFDLLIVRYRNLTSYSDLTNVIQIMRRPAPSAEPGQLGEVSHRVESRMICDIDDGELRITTPGSQLRDELRRAIGLNVRLAAPAGTENSTEDSGSASGAEQAALAYQLWLAPHMSLHFAEQPLQEFRPGVRDGFTATEAAPVTIDDRVMVHVELTSCDGTSEDAQAKFDLYVNPESMLIERIEGRQRLPDGGSFETTLTITPMSAEGASAALRTEKSPKQPCADVERLPAATPLTPCPGDLPLLEPVEPGSDVPMSPAAEPLGNGSVSSAL